MGWSDASLSLVLVGSLAVSACKDDPKSSQQSEKVIAQSGEIAQEEENLISRRDSLLANRRSLKEERTALNEELRQARETGGDTAELQKKADALAQKEQGLEEEEDQLNSKLDEILSQRRAITQALASAGGNEAGKMAAREAGLAEREKALARREDRVGQREAALAERERAVQKYKMEKCGAAQPTTIIQTVDAKGSKYTKRDVEPLLSNARKQMSKKGILHADLPEPAQGLEREATKAMAEGDYGRARFAAAQLVAAIRSTKVNKGFISAKISRLSGMMKGRTLSGDKQKEVDSLFREATAAYGDGKFGSANRRLNKIYMKIR